MNNLRRHKIGEILRYLEGPALQTATYKEAVSENIGFFKSSYSFFSFYKWLYKKGPKIRRENLLELMDIDADSPYAVDLITSLAALEARVYPGMITPLVRKICRYVREEESMLIINLGSGAMEVEKQVIARLIRSENKKPVIFVGIDKLQRAHAFARQNLNVFGPDVDIIEKEVMDDDSLNMISANKKSLYTVVLCSNDVFSFDKRFISTRFDLAFNCFFKHHFDVSSSEKIDSALKKFSKKVIEYDGLNNNFNSFTQTVFVWNNPVLLNGAVFSNLRYIKKKN
jgi:hypothetical protein